MLERTVELAKRTKDRTIACPDGHVQPIRFGTTVEFDPDICDHCTQRLQCTTAELGNGRTVAIAENEGLQQRLRKQLQTSAGRAAVRERTTIEHKLAHISQRQGNHARYVGVRTNTFDSGERAPSKTSRHSIARRSNPERLPNVSTLKPFGTLGVVCRTCHGPNHCSAHAGCLRGSAAQVLHVRTGRAVGTLPVTASRSAGEAATGRVARHERQASRCSAFNSVRTELRNTPAAFPEPARARTIARPHAGCARGSAAQGCSRLSGRRRRTARCGALRGSRAQCSVPSGRRTRTVQRRGTRPAA